MANRSPQFGNDLYTGKRSFDFVGGRKLWFLIAGVARHRSRSLIPVAPRRFNSRHRVPRRFGVHSRRRRDRRPASSAIDAVQSVVPDADAARHDRRRQHACGCRPTSSTHDRDAARSRTPSPRPTACRVSEVTSSFIGPTWGADVTRQALVGLGVFLALAALIMALYFRTWKMSLAAIIGLLDDLDHHGRRLRRRRLRDHAGGDHRLPHDPRYSLYDTVVVFDKIRENTAEDGQESRRTFARVGEPRGQPDPGPLDQHDRRGGPAGRRDPVHRRRRARGRHAARHLAGAASSASSSAPTRRSSSPRRCTRSSARASRRSSRTTRRC